MKKRIVTIAGAAALVTVVLMLVGALYERRARASALSEFPAPGRMVSLGTHSLHLDCRGAGEPTIILESGMDPFGSLAWTLQHDRLAAMTRTCAYDRAGIAWSEIGPNPRDGAHIARELRALLERAGEGGPYVVIGHSMGGPYARIFAGAHREDVVGLMLVESSHPEQFERMPPNPTWSPPPALLIRAFPLLRRVGIARHLMKGELEVRSLPPEHQEALRAVSAGSVATILSEFSNIEQSLLDAAKVDSLGDLPLTVISIGTAPDAARIPDFTQAEAEEGFAAWDALQAELAELSTESHHVGVPEATHYLQFSSPDALVEAVEALLARLD